MRPHPLLHGHIQTGGPTPQLPSLGHTHLLPPQHTLDQETHSSSTPVPCVLSGWAISTKNGAQGPLWGAVVKRLTCCSQFHLIEFYTVKKTLLCVCVYRLKPLCSCKCTDSISLTRNSPTQSHLHMTPKCIQMHKYLPLFTHKAIQSMTSYTHTPTHTLQPYVHNQAPTKALIHKEICSGTQFTFRNQIHTLLQVQYPQIHTEVNTSSTHTNIHTIHSVIQVNAHINR